MFKYITNRNDNMDKNLSFETMPDSELILPVMEIAEGLKMEQSTISHQLRVLRQNKLVRVRREGKQIYYALDDDHVKKIIEMGLDHVLE